MFDQAFKYILDVAFGLLVYAFLLRFVMQALRAPFRNPFGQAVMALTDWAVKPLRKLVSGVGGYDWASLLAAWLVQTLWIAALFALFGSGFAGFSGSLVAYVFVVALLELLKSAIWLLIVVVIVQAVLSWVAPDGPLAGLVNALTFPFLRPLRRIIPPLGGALDITPLILIVLLQIVLMVPVRWVEQQLPVLFR